MEFEFKDLVSVWSSGGWLMLPLLMLALYMYFTALDLYFRIRTHFLIHNKVYEFSDAELQRELRRGLNQRKTHLHEDTDLCPRKDRQACPAGPLCHPDGSMGEG